MSICDEIKQEKSAVTHKVEAMLEAGSQDKKFKCLNTSKKNWQSPNPIY